MPHRLIYRSRVANQVRFEDAEAIAEISAKNNEKVGVTGLLVYTPSHFLQVLEGDEEAVRAIYARVGEDSRHTRVKTLFDGKVAEGQFGAWSMKATMPTAGMRSEALEALDADSALRLLSELR